MQLGERWGYRARQKDDLAPVRVVRMGTAKPVRVLVQFESLEMEGHQEWVPPARLKVPWGQVAEYEAREARWAALTALSPGCDTIDADAAHEVFAAVVADEVARMDWRDHYLMVADVAALSVASGIPAGEFTGDPMGFMEDGRLAVSWPVALSTAKALAERDPEPILAVVATEERRFQREAIHGAYRGGSRGLTVSPETIQEVDAEYYRPRREVLRSWCGAAAVDRWDELAELRKEIKRVGDVAEQCIQVLRSHGLARDADLLAGELGQTVEMLRESAD